MDYQAAVRYLLSLGRELAAPTQAAATKFNLENITLLERALGHPLGAYPSVHIAGTNGKGSTAAFLESILRQAGLRTGLYTSPHLERINERIRVDGAEIPDLDFADVFTEVQRLTEELLAEARLRAHPTYFECVTAMAFEYFARQRVELAVLEVGLGGRLDATNIVTPAVSVITRIDFDHEGFLGHSLAEIAGEKAGILKPRVPVILAPQRPEVRQVLVDRAGELECPVVETSAAYRMEGVSARQGFFSGRVVASSGSWSLDVQPALPGRFQLENALNAVAAARLLAGDHPEISDLAIREGLAGARWPGRLEKLQEHPDVYLDGAHNPAAAAELAGFLRENLPGRRLWFLFGALRDKAVDEISGLLFPLAHEVVFTEPATSRSISAAELAHLAGHHAPRFRVCTSPEEALEELLLRAAPGDAILITGSLYLVGQLRHYWRQRSQVATRPKNP